MKVQAVLALPGSLKWQAFAWDVASCDDNDTANEAIWQLPLLPAVVTYNVRRQCVAEQ